MTIAVNTEGVAEIQPNKEVLRDWVEALESGEYQQTTGTLKNQRGYCCLGVLCELAVAAGVISGPVQVEEIDLLTGELKPLEVYKFDGAEAFPPDAVNQWAFGDPDEQNPELSYDDDMHPASHLNDEFDLSFSEIAQAIRETYNL